MAARPLITAWAGSRPSHFELAREGPRNKAKASPEGRPETGPPEAVTGTWDPVQAGPRSGPETWVPVWKQASGAV